MPAPSDEKGSEDKHASSQQLWGVLDREYSSVVMRARLDFSTYLEEFGSPPPVMFSDLVGLESWAYNNNLEVNAVPGDRKGNFRHVTNDTVSSYKQQLVYSQLWVRASHPNYRSVFAAWHAKCDRIAIKQLSDLHADHVINRRRLREFHPNAWVVLFPVPADANITFGSRIEKKLLSIDANQHSVYLEALYAFKLFTGHMPKTKVELEIAMKRFRGQFLYSDRPGAYTHTFCEAAYQSLQTFIDK